MRGVLVLAALLVPAGAGAGGPKPQPTRGPVTVFVTAKKAPKPPSPQELRAVNEKADRLEKQFDEMEKADRKQLRGSPTRPPARGYGDKLAGRRWCMMMRGMEKLGSATGTCFLAGAFCGSAELRAAIRAAARNEGAGRSERRVREGLE